MIGMIGPSRVLPLAALVLLGACASSSSPLLITLNPPGPGAWADDVRRVGLSPDELVNPLAYTEEMKLEAESAAGDTGLPAERLRRLQNYLFQRSEGFNYETFGTATAIEAFETRSGNCVAFTNLFIAMSRSLGIPAVPALVQTGGGSTETDGDLTLVKNHIVALLDEGGRASIYDFFRLRNSPVAGIQPIDDLWMAAIYQNNKGVQALRDGDTFGAMTLFESAVKLAPSYAAGYGNLGVTRRRTGDPYGALDTYLVALQIDRHNTAIRTNLTGLLQDLAPETPDDEMQAGDRALAQGELKRARKHYRRARKLRPERHESLVALARVELLRGRLAHAKELLNLASAAAADDEQARRLLAALDRLEQAPPMWPVRLTGTP
jgi:Flp pilus assembly protein TadD